MKTHPVKARARIVLASRCNVLMAGDVCYRVVPVQGLAQLAQLHVLGVFEYTALQAFEFDADGVVIALGASSVLRLTGMPGPIVGTDKLAKVSVSPNKKVRGYLQTTNLREVRMSFPVQLVGEQCFDLLTTVLAGW